jgi:hypothetical protein
MKTLLVVAMLALATSASAQTPAETVSSDVYEIGSRTIRIPAPEGFTKIGLRYNHILSVQVAAEPSKNEIFALHLPSEQLSKYLTDFDGQPDVFTKVSVSRVGRNEDITPAGFAAAKVYIEQEFARITDPDSPAMKAGQQNVSKNLTELLDSHTKIKWDRPVNLGVFERGDRVYSTLTLISPSANRTSYKFLASVSFVYVNSRLIYVYAYKSNPVEADVELLRDFTRRWTAAIVAANDELTAKAK